MDVRAENTPRVAVNTAGGISLPRRPWITLSPINRRRWQNFKANGRGYLSLWIFSALFLISLFAEFIANDKPFLVVFDGKPEQIHGASRTRISGMIMNAMLMESLGHSQ